MAGRGLQDLVTSSHTARAVDATQIRKKVRTGGPHRSGSAGPVYQGLLGCLGCTDDVLYDFA